MHELERIAATLALFARPLPLSRAEKKLREPEREALLADAAPSLDENAAGERSASDAVREAAPQRIVAEKGYEGHAWNMAARPPHGYGQPAVVSPPSTDSTSPVM